ncbi:MAG: ABC transporter permease [Bacteroidales bacterium]|nr:ABC transporter permease [Bacteroidales bacterium]
MNFSFFVAKKYFFSKKSANVINIISLISLIGVAFGTMAFIVVLSVFNGIENLVSSLFSSFDPDLKIELNEGKSFITDTVIFDELKNHPQVAFLSFVIEENGLIEYDGKQMIATIKAVDENYKEVTGVDSMMYNGSFVLEENPRFYAVVGYGIAAKLGITTNLIFPLKIWAPIRSEGITLNSQNAFENEALSVSGIFTVQQEYDEKYVIVPIDFARELMQYGNRATAVEIKLLDENSKKTQNEIQQIVGDGFVVKNRFEQKQLVYKIMKSERWAIFAILSFILLVSSFNIVGTMIMLIIDKKIDVSTLNSIGADIESIRRIFLFEGWMISAAGAVIGLVLGLGITLAQQFFGLLKFPTSGSFISNAYPIEVHFLDTLLVFGVVIAIGFLVANYPVRYITRKFFTVN